jgi:hypothetical protein
VRRPAPEHALVLSWTPGSCGESRCLLLASVDPSRPAASVIGLRASPTILERRATLAFRSAATGISAIVRLTPAPDAVGNSAMCASVSPAPEGIWRAREQPGLASHRNCARANLPRFGQDVHSCTCASGSGSARLTVRQPGASVAHDLSASRKGLLRISRRADQRPQPPSKPPDQAIRTLPLWTSTAGSAVKQRCTAPRC